MDTSETYIKMCKKAIEIKELWMPTRGDLFAYVEGDMKYHIHINLQSYSPQYLVKYPVYVWLPRQDQLQEMVGYPVMGGLRRLLVFMDISSPTDGWDSLEQLWLAFVMKEKHQKIWNGEDWEIREEAKL